jgi:hypothetical protein
MKVSRSMAFSSGLSQQSLRKVCPLGLEFSFQQNLHIGLATFHPAVRSTSAVS